MPVIATAGHVDHGKSTLVQALTGRDPDRWEEEKRRGMTIDLGFAWMVLPSGRTISFVDVPGHRRFIGNMLAGVGPVDAALLVVAADEGWMPQSEEHLAVLDLLGVDRAVVAVTKVDRVDPEAIARQQDQIYERLSDTSLHEAEIVPVSAVNGDGLDSLRAALDRTVRLEAKDQGRPRLWVDRVFTVLGAGTVVTGTLIGGSLNVGDEVSVWPSHPTVRIRTLQTSEETVDRVGPSTRVAVNLAGIEREDVKRGSVLTRSGMARPTKRMLVRLERPRYEKKLNDRGSYLLYVGTYSSKVQLRLLDDLGEFSIGVLEVEHAVAVEAGDRFIVRDSGRQIVIAGGAVLDSDPSRRRRDLIPLGRDLIGTLDKGADAIASVLLDHRRRTSLADLSVRSGGGTPGGAMVVGDEALSDSEARRLAIAAAEIVAAFHQSNRLEKGIGIGQLAAGLGVDAAVARAVVTNRTELEVSGSLVSAPGRDQDEIDSDPRWLHARQVLVEAGMSPPPLRELGLDGELLRMLVRTRRLVRVSDDFAYLPDQAARMIEVLRSLEGAFSVSDFRQKAGISRKHAIPFLEYTDREAVTIRSGDQRTVRD